MKLTGLLVLTGTSAVVVMWISFIHTINVHFRSNLVGSFKALFWNTYTLFDPSLFIIQETTGPNKENPNTLRDACILRNTLLIFKI
jgi:hypothetical protein